MRYGWGDLYCYKGKTGLRKWQLRMVLSAIRNKWVSRAEVFEKLGDIYCDKGEWLQRLVHHGFVRVRRDPKDKRKKQYIRVYDNLRERYPVIR